jgi:predicted 3-demethylubiquinone-9 3-methyltransferase (glyoxalase superfamily)
MNAACSLMITCSKDTKIDNIFKELKEVLRYVMEKSFNTIEVKEYTLAYVFFINNLDII